jgi:hypothetical protein
VLVVGRETKDNFNLMINKLLESIYSKTFLGSRSLSGGCNKKSKNDASNTELNKPGLPDDDLNEIIIEQSKDFIPKHCKLCFHFIILVDRVFQRYMKKHLRRRPTEEKNVPLEKQSEIN